MFDACIVGGGIIGCAILRDLSLSGYQCVLLEKEKELITQASAKNSGICHSGYDNDKNITPLENKCIKKGHHELLKLHHYSNLPLKKTGALLCAWTNEQVEKLPEILKLAYSNEVFTAKIVDKRNILKLEPNLNPKVLGGIEIPDEFIVDPWITPIFYAIQSIENGARIQRNSKVTSIKKKENFWSVNFLDKTTKKLENINSKYIINCAGIYGDIIENFKKNSNFQMKPRKGEFLMLENSKIFERIILPVWNEKTKGVLVANTIHDNTLIGPTAEEQMDRDEAVINQKTLNSLLKKGKEISTKINENNIINSYAGLRPATQFKDYQFNFDLKNNWITIGGIRSTGLSSALGISNEVLRELNLTRIKSDKQIYEESKVLISKILDELKMNGYLEFRGEKYMVTHPITQQTKISKSKL
eukprot:gene12132-5623_t